MAGKKVRKERPFRSALDGPFPDSLPECGVGTALTLQICLGFLLTTASIELIGKLHETVGWRWAFAALAPGPALGVVAMIRLRSLPEAAKIAQGRR